MSLVLVNIDIGISVKAKVVVVVVVVAVVVFFWCSRASIRSRIVASTGKTTLRDDGRIQLVS